MILHSLEPRVLVFERDQNYVAMIFLRGDIDDYIDSWFLFRNRTSFSTATYYISKHLYYTCFFV